MFPAVGYDKGAHITYGAPHLKRGMLTYVDNQITGTPINNLVGLGCLSSNSVRLKCRFNDIDDGWLLYWLVDQLISWLVG